MKLLLDTHAFLWFVMGDSRLTISARSAIEDNANEKYVSAASAWEIAVKVSLGRLNLGEPFGVLVPREIYGNGFKYLPVELSHAAIVAGLPFHHRDPFDRLLVAQSLVEQMTMVGVDVIVDAYGVPRIW